MDSVTVRQRIRAFILTTFPAARLRGLPDSEPLLEEGIVDSLGILAVVRFIETAFDMPVEDDDLTPEHFASIEAIAAFVEGKQCLSWVQNGH